MTTYVQGEFQEEKLGISRNETSLEAVNVHGKPGPALGCGCGKEEMDRKVAIEEAVQELGE